MTRRSLTALSDFGRSLRPEPAFGVYKHRVYLQHDKVPEHEVHAWLKKRYTSARRGHLYRLVTYLHADGNRYVDFIWLQTFTENDLLEVKMRWGYSEHKVQRGEMVPRRRLTKEQYAARRAAIAKAEREFYEALDRSAAEKQ